LAKSRSKLDDEPDITAICLFAAASIKLHSSSGISRASSAAARTKVVFAASGHPSTWGIVKIFPTNPNREDQSQGTSRTPQKAPTPDEFLSSL
jgi:hypothetical protein